MTSPAAPPSSEEISRLEPFERLGLEAIRVVDSPDSARAALAELAGHEVVGFDTEARPTFRVGETSQGPHVVQFAGPARAWVFLLRDEACRDAAARLLAEPGLAKVGFGLEGDRSQIQRKFGLPPRGVHDLNTVLRRLGYARSLGARRAVALLFRRRFIKSKRLTTSNWSLPALSAQQIAYAANDAWAAFRVWQALGLEPRQLEADNGE
jgi:ribonuclease D